eukprot:4949742-Amphidinium_carterae.1
MHDMRSRHLLHRIASQNDVYAVNKAAIALHGSVLDLRLPHPSLVELSSLALLGPCLVQGSLQPLPAHADSSAFTSHTTLFKAADRASDRTFNRKHISLHDQLLQDSKTHNRGKHVAPCSNAAVLAVLQFARCLSTLGLQSQVALIWLFENLLIILLQLPVQLLSAFTKEPRLQSSDRNLVKPQRLYEMLSTENMNEAWSSYIDSLIAQVAYLGLRLGARHVKRLGIINMSQACTTLLTQPPEFEAARPK